MKYDLHTHSYYSDGELSPATLVEQAAGAGINAMALTDHDTLAGLDEAKFAAQQQGIELVTGVEVSCQWGKQEVHLVGLNVNVANPELQTLLSESQQRRRQRLDKILQKLQPLGIGGLAEAVDAEVGHATAPGRLHIARALVKLGAVKNIPQAFNRYLGKGQRGYVPTNWPEIDTVVSVIANAGGVSVLAHLGKYKLSRTKQRRLAEDFSAASGDALEVVVGGQSPNDQAWMVQLANELGLLGSVASDYHGPSQTWLHMGALSALPESCPPVWRNW